MIGTNSATNGTVRARWFFSVSTYSAPPPSLASTARLSRTVAGLTAKAGAMTGQQHYTARQAGYPARNYPNRIMRPVPNAVTLSLWLNA
jgi:hypothetical protein